jgi:hypothetical protein
MPAAARTDIRRSVGEALSLLGVAELRGSIGDREQRAAQRKFSACRRLARKPFARRYR